MTDRCEPPPELRGVDGWHYVKAGDTPVECWRWTSTGQYWQSTTAMSVRQATSYGYCYIAPVATPAEVEALRAERDAFAQQAGECSGGYQTLEREVTTLRARVAELEKVVALYQAEVGAFTGRGTTLARLTEIDEIARAALSAETP